MHEPLERLKCARDLLENIHDSVADFQSNDALSLALSVQCNHRENAPNEHDAFMNALMPIGIGSRWY